MAERNIDLFVNQAYGEVVPSVTDALSFQEIATGVSTFEKMAWVLQRAHWFVSVATLNELQAVTDAITLAITISDKMTSLGLDDAAVIDMVALYPALHGTAGNMETVKIPIVSDFSTLPGGGVIIPPRPIYIAMQSAGFSAARSASCRIYFTTRKLAADEYWELVEARRMIE